MSEVDDTQFYDLESHVFITVRSRFITKGYLSVEDFFYIIIWKANRSKSMIAERLCKRHPTLAEAVHKLTGDISDQTTSKDRLRLLIQDWGLRLPVASAILAVLCPDEYAIYDVRVCHTLGDDLDQVASEKDFDKMWEGYCRYVRHVEDSGPPAVSLRQKDRYLWGKDFYQQLTEDAAAGFPKKVTARQFTPERGLRRRNQ